MFINKLKKKDKKAWVVLLVCLGTLLFSGVISVLQQQGVLSWRQVYSKVGVADTPAEVQNYSMAVHVIDVGKADSIYIRCEDKNILIDAGEKSTNKVVNEYLHHQDVKKLDLVVATHPHSDHVGGMADVINELPIERFMMPNVKEDIVPTSKSYENMLKALTSKNVKVEQPVPGSSFDLGPLKVYVFAPGGLYDNVNNHSIVVKMTYKNKSFLFAGDAEKESEDDMIKKGYDLKSDVLKVGHHGSKTSSSVAFLKKVNPSTAVISVGDDRYNLPKQAIIDRLKQHKVTIYRTDLDGTVILATDGEKIEVFKQKE